MLTQEQRELFQKDKYELVDMIVGLRKKLKENGVEVMKEKSETWKIPNDLGPIQGTIERVLDKLNKEMDYGNKEENQNKAFKEEEC